MDRTPMFELWRSENALDVNKKSSDHIYYSLHFETYVSLHTILIGALSLLIQHNLHHLLFFSFQVSIPDILASASPNHYYIITFTINPNHHLHILFENRFFLPCRCYYCLEYFQPFARPLKRPSLLLPSPPTPPPPHFPGWLFVLPSVISPKHRQRPLNLTVIQQS